MPITKEQVITATNALIDLSTEYQVAKPPKGQRGSHGLGSQTELGIRREISDLRYRFRNGNKIDKVLSSGVRLQVDESKPHKPHKRGRKKATTPTNARKLKGRTP